MVNYKNSVTSADIYLCGIDILLNVGGFFFNVLNVLNAYKYVCMYAFVIIAPVNTGIGKLI